MQQIELIVLSIPLFILLAAIVYIIICLGIEELELWWQFRKYAKKDKKMTQKEAEPNCSDCHIGWANQGADGKIESCYDQCKFNAILDRHLIEYANAWKELARL